MENGVGIVGDTTMDAEERAARMEMAPAGFSDSHVTNGLLNDSAENEVFEDTITDAESFYRPHHLESGMVSEGSDGDLRVRQGVESIPGSLDVEVNDQSREKDEIASSDVVESIAPSQVNDISHGQVVTTKTKDAVYPAEEPEDSHVSIHLRHADNNNGDVEGLNVDGFTEDDSSLSQKLDEPLGKEIADEFENAAQAEDGEGMREIKRNDDESDGAIVETYSVPDDDGEIVSQSNNENLDSEKSQNGVIGDETSFRNPSVDWFECEEDILNMHEVEEIKSESVDDVREVNGLKVEADSLLVEEGCAYSEVTSENDEHLTRSGGPISQSKSTAKDDKAKESVLVEDIGELSSTDDDDENNAFSQQVPQSHSRPEPSVTPLPSRPAGLGSSAPLLEPAPRSLPSSRVNGSVSHQQTQISEGSITDDTEESDEIREKLQIIRKEVIQQRSLQSTAGASTSRGLDTDEPAEQLSVLEEIIELRGKIDGIADELHHLRLRFEEERTYIHEQFDFLRQSFGSSGEIPLGSE